MAGSGTATAGRNRTARGAAAVTQALQRYADRGVFRGFSVRRHRGGPEYRFTWLTRRPMALIYGTQTRALTFRNVLPGVGQKPGLLAELKALVRERTGRGVPEHQRIEPRRARVSLALVRGRLSVKLSVRGQHHEYAVQRGLKLIHEMFVLLHASYPDYLSEHFELPAE